MMDSCKLKWTCLNAVCLLTYLCVIISGVACKGSNSTATKDIVVVGGGLAGMAAARRLMQSGKYNVRVFEGRQNRYGGRIWTNRVEKQSRGAEVELGAMYLNTRAKNNPLFDMAKKFELPIKNSGSLMVFLPDQNLVLSGDNATDLYGDVLTVMIQAVNKVKKSNVDRPLTKAVEEELKVFQGKFDLDIVEPVLKSIPTMFLEDFSSLQYEIENELGWDAVIIDGQDTFLDRIVSGDGMESPIKIELNKYVKQVKVDKKRNKVLLRTTDRKQTIVDKVLLALPVGMYGSKSIVFEPYLPNTWYKAIKELGKGYFNKLIVGFEQAFWPQDVGSFTVISTKASSGFLQMWTNLYRLTGKPYLTSNIYGSAAAEFENLSDMELKEKVTSILSEMFGKDLVARYNITTFMRSQWTYDYLTYGSVSYPRTGSTDALWETLKKPSCPHIYFAGAYTASNEHVDSLHGAYNSGIHAAEQIITGVCEKEKQEKEKKKKKVKNENIKAVKKAKVKKDEL